MIRPKGNLVSISLLQMAKSNMEISAILSLGLFSLLLRIRIDVEASQHGIEYVQYQVPESQPYRTAYHFQSPMNWLNDPNGPMYHEGVYHLFYQYNPYGAVFGDSMIWAHSVSYDLINWVHLDHAIEPSDPFDINSCWSGSATILPGNKPAILYTGIDANNYQVQNLAFPKNLSDPFLRVWEKYTQNPVITPPSTVDALNFRDPTTAWQGEDGKWRVIVGARNGHEGMAILYQSEDFVNWTVHLSPFYRSDSTGIWECPDFYPVSINSTNGVDTSVHNPSVKHVMKASFQVNWHDCYVLGTYDPEKENFIPEDDFTGTNLDLRFDYGKFYASKTFFDPAKNRRILWAWVNESDSSQDDIEKGWAGLQSIPRQVWLDKSGKQLIQWPIEEIDKLRDKQVSINGKELISGSIFEVSGITASQADVEVSFELPELESAELIDPTRVDAQLLCSEENASSLGIIGPFGLLVLAAKDLAEQTAIFFRVYKAQNRYIGLMCSDQSRSSLRNELDKTTYGAFFRIDPNLKKISLRSLIDHSIVESFGEEGRIAITSRVYPLLAIDKEAYLYAFNNGTLNVGISKLNAWSMKKTQFDDEQSFSYSLE
ncbi:Beta-fructofuranosidase, insoluble isoenzyme like [Quillaja saponaria]|uniref:Acid beta-fructofuranosidase n=1 Tax=Quillaja saponaria TaxID=32244 RepID=A0AAD7PTM3_QUISA|nr:Beta-fructofuranosidase, insoluble isoenzyme like [Quillaja saponaria]